MTDRELIEDIKKGDQEAFRSFVDQYQVMVKNTCMGFLHNREDSEDVAQDTFIEAYQSIQRFRGDAKISTWLYRIAVNKSLNYLRDNKKHILNKNVEESISVGENGVDENISSNPEKMMEETDRKITLRRTINSLSRNQRIAFVLNKYDNLSYKEIAEIMNTSLSSVESLIFRAKQAIQKTLLNYYRKNML